MPFTSAGFLFFFLPITIIVYYLFNFIGKNQLNNLLLILFKYYLFSLTISKISSFE